MPRERQSLKPQGGSPADVDAEERTAENRRSLREKMRIWTWNVRTMNQGKLDIMKREMERTGVERMGISEMRWTGMGHFMSDDYEVYYCGQETLRRNGVAFICTDEIRRCVMGFNPVSDRMATIRLQWQASKHDCLASIRSNIYSGRRRHGRVL